MADWTDPLFRLRYGVTGNDKYRLALSGRIPGAQPIQSEDDVAREERRAAAYLFAMQHPALADFGVGLANTLRFMEPESLHQVAIQGKEAAKKAPRTLRDLINW